MACFHTTKISNVCQAQKGGEFVTAPVALAPSKAAEAQQLQSAETSFGTSGLSWGLLVYKDREAVRAHVALAIVKLLKRLPEAALRAALPTSLQKVANLLRTRLQRIR